MTLSALTESIGSLTPPDPDAASVYAAGSETFVADVDAAILAHPRLEEFLDGNSQGLLLANHRNHAGFMAEVFRSGSLADLPSTAVWAHRAYRARGVHSDYFAAHLPEWPASFARHGLAEPLRDVAAVYEWLHGSHEAMVALADEPALRPRIDPGLQERFVDLMVALDLAGCVAVVDEAMDGGMTITEILTGCIHPALHTVGIEWENGRFSPAEEHRATAIASRLVGGMLARSELSDLSGGTLVVTSAESEFHDLGALTLAIFFEGAGWDVTFLGANTPNQDVASLAADLNADIVAVSVTMPTNLGSVRELVDTVRRRTDARILVGGGVFERCPTLAANVSADCVTADPVKALHWATS
jgi:methanogenic corrinoid protein MtbC1